MNEIALEHLTSAVAALVRSEKFRSNSRTLRRFFETNNLSTQSFSLVLASDNGWSPSQFDKLSAFADEVLKDFEERAEYLKHVGAVKVVRKKEGLLKLQVSTLAPAEPPTLKQLQDAIRLLEHLLDAYQFTWRRGLKNALGKCKDYTYRGLACNIASGDELWEISGYDKRTGGSGVLEWCFDEEDAKALLQKMQEFPHRFEALSACSHGRGYLPALD